MSFSQYLSESTNNLEQNDEWGQFIDIESNIKLLVYNNQSIIDKPFIRPNNNNNNNTNNNTNNNNKTNNNNNNNYNTNNNNNNKTNNNHKTNNNKTTNHKTNDNDPIYEDDEKGKEKILNAIYYSISGIFICCYIFTISKIYVKL